MDVWLLLFYAQNSVIIAVDIAMNLSKKVE